MTKDVVELFLGLAALALSTHVALWRLKRSDYYEPENFLAFLRWTYGPVLAALGAAFAAAEALGFRELLGYVAVALPAVLVAERLAPVAFDRHYRRLLWTAQRQPARGYGVVPKDQVLVERYGTRTQIDEARVGSSDGPTFAVFDAGDQYPLESTRGITVEQFFVVVHGARSGEFLAMPPDLSTPVVRMQVENRHGRARLVEIIEAADEPLGQPT